ncbi:MAG: immunoglobulin domain-containing protein [Verrucomicrobiota bacterium]
MKNRLITTVFFAGLLVGNVHASGFKLASAVDRKRFNEEMHRLALVQRSEAAAGSDPWDNYATPESVPVQTANIYQVMSRASLPIPQIYVPARITSSPSSVKVDSGRPVTLRVGATGTEIIEYQWRRNGVEIPGAQSSTYSFTASLSSAGSYDCVVWNLRSLVVSGSAAVTVTQPINGKFVGTFHGLIERDPALNTNLASSIQLTTTASGLYSGKIQSGLTSIPLAGQFAVSAQDQTKATLSQFIPKLGATLSLTLDTATDTLSGTFKKANSDGVAVSGWRNSWAEVAGNAAKFKGLHTFTLRAVSGGAEAPQGYGFGALSIAEKTGLLTLVGTLPDGSAMTGSTFVGSAGQVLVYVPLYSNLGSLAGTLKLTVGSSAPIGNVITGSPTWLKPTPAITSRDTVYKAGFGPVELDAEGGFYIVPAKGERVLGLPVATNNAQFTFSVGGLDTEGKEFTQSVTISNPSPLGLTNKVSISSSLNKVAVLSVNPATGTFSGEFTVAGSSRKGPFSGQIVTVSGVTKGYGFFLLPKVPGVKETLLTAPKLSGAVVLEKTP